MRLSLRWAERFEGRFGSSGTRSSACSGRHGEDLRLFSAQALVEMGFHGYSIGDWRSGSRRRRCSTCSTSWSALPSDSRAISWAWEARRSASGDEAWRDMCDCVMRPARDATGWCSLAGPSQLRNARFADDPRPVDPLSSSPMAGLFPRYWAIWSNRGDPRDDGPDRSQPRLLSGSHARPELAISEGRLDAYIEDTHRNWAEGETEGPDASAKRG